MKITMAQHSLLSNQLQSNHKYILDIIQQNSDSDLIIFPELALCGYNKQLMIECGNNYELFLADYKEAAKQNRVAVLLGTVGLNNSGKFVNCSLFINENGKLLAKYDKIHLFKAMGEDRFFQAGDQITTLEFNGWKIGLMTCYDLRFPELARLLTLSKCNLLIANAAWPLERVEIFKNLSMSRAIENQLWVASVNQPFVQDSHPSFGGNSMIIAPDGKIVYQAPSEEKTFTTEIDLTAIDQARSSINSLADRRLDLYSINETS